MKRDGGKRRDKMRGYEKIEYKTGGDEKKRRKEMKEKEIGQDQTTGMERQNETRRDEGEKRKLEKRREE